MTDKIIFNENSGLHLSPTNPPSRFSEEFSFTIKIDGEKQNYISLKLHSSLHYTPIFLYIDGKQLGYAKCSDFEAINLCYGNFKPEGCFYVTTALPIYYTKGKNEIELTLRQAEPYDTLYEVHGTIFEAYSTTTPTFTLPENKTPFIKKSEESIDADRFSQYYIHKQVEFFNKSLAKLRNGEKLSITKYVEEFRHFCMMLFEPYCPLSDKAEGVRLIISCINLYVKDYFENPKTLLHNAHQSDWGGYYGELGQGLYIIEKLIDKTWFESYLSSPFDKTRTIKEAWETCLKANFDFASSRQSYIYNQTYYTYEGAWKAMAGLGVINSKHYIGKEKCDLILKEALGLAPWKGEHILFDKNGRELDLYHCLFNHDKNARFTEDYINIVCTGEAIQGIDENGNFLRRKPYGENYIPLTHRALSRENGYVGNYGETCNYLPQWVYRTFNHGDYELSDLILKAALENINSRMYMRYMGADENGNAIMLMEQAIDERNPTMNPKPAYGAIINDKRTLLFASLERHMKEHSERYTAPHWDRYKLYAKKAVDAVIQSHHDSHLITVLESLAPNCNDFKIDRTIKDILSAELTYLLPHTPEAEDKEFVFFDIDNLLLSLRDGDTHIFAQLNHRNRGYSGFGRAHIIKKGTHHLTQFKTDGIFTYGGKFIRQQQVNMDFIADSQGSNSYSRGPVPLCEFGATPQALCGEEQSITYQKGIGKVNRENFEVDTPYSGYPDFIWAKIDDYFICCNTTRESYENAQTYTLPFKVNGEEITLEPFNYKVIKTEDEIPIPASVTVLNALYDREGILLSWKVSEGKSYNIYRNGRFLANTAENVYLDRSVTMEHSYTYSVTSILNGKESHPSPEKSITATLRSTIGDCQCYASSSRVEIENAHFSTGNDYKLQKRSIRDSLLFSPKAVNGSMSISGQFSNCGIMARENTDSDCRYAYIGFEKDKIIIRTRSKNTIYTFSEEKLSPRCYEFDKGDFTHLKLIVEKDLHSVCFFASKGDTWQLIHREVLPLPEIYYLGVAILHKDADFKELARLKEDYPYPFPIKGVTHENNTFFIEKGLDNKYLLIESSQNGERFNIEKNNLVSSTYSVTSPKPYYRITPVNRHGVMGEGVIIKAFKEDY